MELHEREVVAGRDPECDIVVPDEQVSRRHCLIQRTGKDYVVKDLGSSNGTLLNGRKITRATLSDGDEIRVGSAVIIFDRTPGKAFSLVVYHGGKPERFPLGRNVVTIGRSTRNKIVLSDHAISLIHAEVAPVEGGYVVRDLKSTNGTLVNGRRIREVRLRPGDKIGFGLSQIEIEFVGGESAVSKTVELVSVGTAGAWEFSEHGEFELLNSDQSAPKSVVFDARNSRAEFRARILTKSQLITLFLLPALAGLSAWGIVWAVVGGGEPAKPVQATLFIPSPSEVLGPFGSAPTSSEAVPFERSKSREGRSKATTVSPQRVRVEGSQRDHADQIGGVSEASRGAVRRAPDYDTVIRELGQELSGAEIPTALSGLYNRAVELYNRSAASLQSFIENQEPESLRRARQEIEKCLQVVRELERKLPNSRRVQSLAREARTMRYRIMRSTPVVLPEK